ncbi:MAG: cell division protein, partial [Bdellovibrionales bacterium]|nr:cell division protein [Bdellovibrionales bacterium]
MKNHRIILIFFFVAGLWGAMVLRGAYLQLMPNPQFEKIKKRQFSKIVRLSSRRGDILDRSGQEMAISVTSYSLFADPKIIKDPYMVGKRLSRYFGTSFKHMYKKVKNKKRRFVWIKRKLDKKDYDRIKSWDIRGLAFKEEFKRVYPNKNLAAHLLGFVGKEQQGLAGLEKRFEQTLSGDGKKIQVQRDARGRALIEDGRIFAETPEGSDIYLTVDKDLQYWVENELAEAVKEHGAESAWAVFLDPK